MQALRGKSGRCHQVQEKPDACQPVRPKAQANEDPGERPKESGYPNPQMSCYHEWKSAAKRACRVGVAGAALHDDPVRGVALWEQLPLLADHQGIGGELLVAGNETA